jgi:small GTP-binding protein
MVKEGARMIQKKICMIGGFAVGKTSLVQRYVHSVFSEKYQTTVGVKIDKKALTIDKQSVMLMLWDIAGDDPFQELPMSYLRGAAGYILVADGTRQTTLEKTVYLKNEILTHFGNMPMVLLLNKADLKTEWEIDETMVNGLRAADIEVLESSAKTGSGVELAFMNLAKKVL